MVGRQKLNGVAQALDLPGLVVGRPAGFQQYGGGGPVGEEWKQLGAGQALSQTDAAGFLGDGDFETDFARSMAMVVCFSTDSSFKKSGYDSKPRWLPDAVVVGGGVHLITAALRLRSG
jgi:hypothetical protein